MRIQYSDEIEIMMRVIMIMLQQSGMKLFEDGT